jgi:hypothetical protein
MGPEQEHESCIDTGRELTCVTCLMDHQQIEWRTAETLKQNSGIFSCGLSTEVTGSHTMNKAREGAKNLK